MFSKEELEKRETGPVILEKTEENFALQIALCDDEEKTLFMLQELLLSLDLPVDLEIQTYNSAMKFLKELQERAAEGRKQPDVIFCDIKMPEMDGISLGKEIRNISSDSYLILLTAYAEYAVEGYETRAFRYLLKPVSQDSIKEVLCAILEEQRRKKKLFAKDGEKEYLVTISDITHLSSEDKYTILYTAAGHYMDRTSLNEYETLLLPYGFFRIHRKYIVNLSCHKSLKKGSVFLKDGTELPVSRRKEGAYKAALIKYLERELL